MLLKNIKIKKITKFYTPKRKRIFVTALVSVAIMLMLLSSLIFLTGCEKITVLKKDILGRFSSEKQSDEAVAAVKQFFDFLIVQDYDSAYVP